MGRLLNLARVYVKRNAEKKDKTLIAILMLISNYVGVGGTLWGCWRGLFVSRATRFVVLALPQAIRCTFVQQAALCKDANSMIV